MDDHCLYRQRPSARVHRPIPRLVYHCPVPSTSWPVSLDLPEVFRLADLAGTERDLYFAQEVSKYLAEIDRDRTAVGHIFLPEALFVAAVVRYARCFVTGARGPVWQELLATLTAEQREFHDLIMTLRHQHIAHSVNSLEEGHVGAVVSDDPRQKEVGSISYGVASFSAMTGPSLNEFIALVGILLARVKDLIKAEKQVVLEAVRKLDYETLRTQPMRAPFSPDWAGIAKPRKRPRNPASRGA